MFFLFYRKINLTKSAMALNKINAKKSIMKIITMIIYIIIIFDKNERQIIRNNCRPLKKICWPICKCAAAAHRFVVFSSKLTHYSRTLGKGGKKKQTELG